MTLDIERERREFEAALMTYKGEVWSQGNMQLAFDMWLAAKRAVVGSAEPVAQPNPNFATFPERVWLNVGDCNEHELAEFSHHHEISWSDSAMDKFDVEYVRADLSAPPAPVSAEPIGYIDLGALTNDRLEKRWNTRKFMGQKTPIYLAPPSTDAKDSLDAKRYRWLRDISVPPHNFYLSVPEEFKDEKYRPEQVDSAIDAAIAAKEAGK